MTLLLVPAVLSGCLTSSDNAEDWYIGGPESEEFAHWAFSGPQEVPFIHFYDLHLKLVPEELRFEVSFKLGAMRDLPAIVNLMVFDVEFVNFTDDNVIGENVDDSLSFTISHSDQNRDGHGTHWNLSFEEIGIRQVDFHINLTRLPASHEGIQVRGTIFSGPPLDRLEDVSLTYENFCLINVGNEYVTNPGLHAGIKAHSDDLPGVPRVCDYERNYYYGFSQDVLHTFDSRAWNLPPPEDARFWDNYCYHCYHPDETGVEPVPAEVLVMCSSDFAWGTTRYCYPLGA